MIDESVADKNATLSKKGSEEKLNSTIEQPELLQQTPKDEAHHFDEKEHQMLIQEMQDTIKEEEDFSD